MADFEQQEQRIAQIFGEDETPDVDQKSLEHYLEYLNAHLTLPCTVKHQEHGGQMKLLSLEDEITEDFYGILADVKTDAGPKVYPLCDLEATDQKSPNYQLLDDYSTWFSNYR